MKLVAGYRWQGRDRYSGRRGLGALVGRVPGCQLEEEWGRIRKKKEKH